MQVKLTNVRLSFPDLFKAKSVNGSEPKFGAAFILNKKDDAAQIDSIRAACRSVATEKWPAKIPPGVKFCVHEGAEKDYDGYGPEIIYISATSTIRPAVVDQRRSPLVVEDGKPYAGCYVNASIRLWAQDNQFGKRVNAQLQGVQFSRDGESFGDKPFDPASAFEDLGGAEPSDAGDPALEEMPEIPF